MKTSREKKPAEENLKLTITTLEMRLAALSARMAAPKKGDRPEQLQAEYMEIAAQLRDMKQGKEKE